MELKLDILSPHKLVQVYALSSSLAPALTLSPKLKHNDSALDERTCS